MSSIKRDVKKKAPLRPEERGCFSRSSPLCFATLKLFGFVFHSHKVSLPRLVAYRYFWLSEGASAEPDRPPAEKTAEIESLFLRDAQAVGRCNCWMSNSAPFFQMVKLIAAIFRAKVRRAMVGRIPLSTRAT